MKNSEHKKRKPTETERKIADLKKETRTSISATFSDELKELLAKCAEDLFYLEELADIRPEDDLMFEIALNKDAQRVINNIFLLAFFDLDAKEEDLINDEDFCFEKEFDKRKAFVQIDELRDEFRANLRTAKAFIAMSHDENNLEYLNRFYSRRDSQNFGFDTEDETFDK